MPPELSERLRPHLDALAEELIEAIREGVPAYRRPLEGEFGAGLKAGVAEALAQFLDLIRDGGSGTCPQSSPPCKLVAPSSRPRS